MNKRIEIAILVCVAAALVLPPVWMEINRARDRAQTRVVVSMLHTAGSSLQEYYGKNGRYPEKLSALGESIFPTVGEPGAALIDYDYTVSGDNFMLRVQLPGKAGLMQIAGRRGQPTVPAARWVGQQGAGSARQDAAVQP